MATNRLQASGETGTEVPTNGTPPKAEAAPGGFKGWIPLLANLIFMPALAYGMTVFVLLPRLHSTGQGTGAARPEATPSQGEHNGGESAGKEKVTVNLNGKILVNVAGTGGTRYLLATLTLVSARADLKAVVDKNDAQLRDVAAGVLASKTIADLEKPGARNLIRTELLSVFNGVLGNSVVTDIYMTEFAIQ